MPTDVVIPLETKGQIAKGTNDGCYDFLYLWFPPALLGYPHLPWLLVSGAVHGHIETLCALLQVYNHLWF